MSRLVSSQAREEASRKREDHAAEDVDEMSTSALASLTLSPAASLLEAPGSCCTTASPVTLLQLLANLTQSPYAECD